MMRTLSPASRLLLSSAMLGWLASAAIANTTTYGTGQGSTVYSDGTINAGDTVQLNDGATVSGNIVNNGALDFNQSSGTLTISGTVSGNGTLNLTNSGTLSLTGNNTSTGDVRLANGTLSLGSANAIGTSGTIRFEGGTLQATASNNTDYSARFSNAANQQYRIDTNNLPNAQAPTLASALTSSGGSFTKLGSGWLFLTGANSYSGGTTVSAGRLSGTVTSLQGNIVNNGNVAFTQSSGSGTYSGLMSGSGSLTKLGNGTLTLTGSNSYSGGTTITSGRLIGTTSTIRGAINNAGAVTFDQSTSGTYSSNITGAGPGGSLTKSGSGVVTLSGNNTYTQGTTLTDGTLALGSANAIGTSGTITFNGGTLQATASNSTDYSARFSNAANQQYRIDTNGRNVTLVSNLTSSGGSFTKLGTGTATLSGSNSYSGGTTVSDGTLIGTTRSLQGAITNDAAVTIDQATDGSYAGAMSGTGSLTKSGSGALTMSGANTYTGATNVSGGALVLNGSLGNTALTVRTGSRLGGSGSIGSSGAALVAIQSGGSLAPGNSPGMLTFNGNLTMSLGSTYDYEVVSGSISADSVDINGVLSLNDTTLSLTNLGTYVVNEKFTLFAYDSLIGTFDGLADDTTFTAGGGNWLINYNDTTGGLNTAAVGTSYITLTAVPEPSALLIGALGLVGLLRRRR